VVEQRISLVTLGVSDLARSIAFYERLGWRRSVKNAPGVAFFQIGGLAMALYPKEEMAKDADISPEGTGFGGITLAQNVRTREDVDRAVAEAVEAGATLLRAPYEISWGGYLGYFADPDGYPWEVAWNPGFEILEDGSIKLPD
jgi:catechol 2,3-dioxygenase-like lactoylglutathione lyase family enzyme